MDFAILDDASDGVTLILVHELDIAKDGNHIDSRSYSSLSLNFLYYCRLINKVTRQYNMACQIIPRGQRHPLFKFSIFFFYL